MGLKRHLKSVLARFRRRRSFPQLPGEIRNHVYFFICGGARPSPKLWRQTAYPHACASLDRPPVWLYDFAQFRCTNRQIQAELDSFLRGMSWDRHYRLTVRLYPKHYPNVGKFPLCQPMMANVRHLLIEPHELEMAHFKAELAVGIDDWETVQADRNMIWNWMIELVLSMSSLQVVTISWARRSPVTFLSDYDRLCCDFITRQVGLRCTNRSGQDAIHAPLPFKVYGMHSDARQALQNRLDIHGCERSSESFSSVSFFDEVENLIEEQSMNFEPNADWIPNLWQYDVRVQAVKSMFKECREVVRDEGILTTRIIDSTGSYGRV